jgi:hypothetical protein
MARSLIMADVVENMVEDVVVENTKEFEKMKLTKSPKIDIKYGTQTEKNREEWINWVFENLAAINPVVSENELKQIATQLFDEISQCGYEEGYDSARSEEE